MTASQPASGLNPSLRVLLVLAASVIALAGLWFAKDLIGPLAIGAVIVIICLPVRAPLMRWGWPSWAANTAVIALGYVILAILVALLWYAGVQFVALIHDLAGQMQEQITGVMEWLRDAGLTDQLSSAAAIFISPSTILGVVESFGSATLAVLTAFFFILAYVIFMAVDAARYSRAEQVFGEKITPTVQRFRAYCTGVRRYFVVNAVFGAIVAIIDGLLLWWMGVPAPAVWAILAFVTNFVPNIGFVLGLIPPALLALVVSGWPLMLGVIAMYCVVNVTLQVMVQPKFVSDAVDLSLTLSFFSVMFWTFIIGPLGAILAIPLTLLVRALVVDADPNNAWLRWLSGVEPHERES